MKKLILTLTLALTAAVSFSQTFNIRGKIEHSKGKNRVVLYEFNGQTWDTAWVDDFRKNYSLMLDPNQRYQIWFTSSTDSVKVLAVDKNATDARTIIVDVDFEWKGCAKITKGSSPFKLILINTRMTPANRPDDFAKVESQITK